MSVIKLPVSTFELTFVAVILGRSMTYDVLHERFPSNGYHVAHRIAIESPSVCMSIFQPLMLVALLFVNSHTRSIDDCDWFRTS